MSDRLSSDETNILGNIVITQYLRTLYQHTYKSTAEYVSDRLTEVRLKLKLKLGKTLANDDESFRTFISISQKHFPE